MLIPKKIIDNTDTTLKDFLNNVLAIQPQINFDVATAFFNLKAYAMVKDNLGQVRRFRLLLGKAPEISTDTTLGEELMRVLREEVEGYDLSRENENLVKDFIQFVQQECLRNLFFQVKSIIFRISAKKRTLEKKNAIP